MKKNRDSARARISLDPRSLLGIDQATMHMVPAGGDGNVASRAGAIPPARFDVARLLAKVCAELPLGGAGNGGASARRAVGRSLSKIASEISAPALAAQGLGRVLSKNVTEVQSVPKDATISPVDLGRMFSKNLAEVVGVPKDAAISPAGLGRVLTKNQGEVTITEDGADTIG